MTNLNRLGSDASGVAALWGVAHADCGGGRVARQVGAGMESLRRWVQLAEVDAGDRPGTTSAELGEIKRLVAQLHQAAVTNLFFGKDRVMTAARSLEGATCMNKAVFTARGRRAWIPMCFALRWRAHSGA